MNNRKIWAVIEFENSHFECMHTIANYLQKKDHTVYFLVSKETAKRMSGLHLYPKANIETFTTKQPWLEASHFCKNHLITHIFLNSASGKKIQRFLFKTLLQKFVISGFVHNPKKSQGSLSQWFIEKTLTHKYVLSPHLLTKRRQKKFKVIQPVFFPKEFKCKSKESKFFEIIIPGQTEFKRRDYQFLMNQITAHHEIFKKEKIIFRCLGPAFHQHGDGARLKKWSVDHGFEDVFSLTERKDNLDDTEFHHIIANAHAILPLIHPSKEQYKDYLQDKFSGAFALSIGHQIPMLLEKTLQQFQQFEPYHFFYGDFLDACLKSKNPDQAEHAKNKLATQCQHALQNIEL